MSQTITIEDAANQLAALISALGPDDEITLLSKNKPVAKIVPTSPAVRRGGACKGMLIENPDVDDDAHLADFAEYM